MTQKPLMLKDFLELDANSESRLEFRSARRRIPEYSGVRMRSQGAALMARVSAAISAVRIFSSSSACPRRRDRGWILPRSFSKRLRRSFWRRSGAAEIERVSVRDIVRLRSFQNGVDDRRSLYFPSPIVSSSSSSSEDGEISGSDFVLSSCGSSEWSGDNEATAAGAGKTDSTKKDLERDEKEEQQLSPVSVMEFPYQEEENDDGENSTTPHCFDQKLAHIERTRQQQMLHKIQRFECRAELEPVNLDARFDDTLDSCYHVGAVHKPREKRARDLLRQLASGWGPQCGSIEKLLRDFFEEGLSLSRSSLGRRRRLSVEEELVKAAGDWIAGVGGGAADDDGEAELKDGGWGCFEAENEGLAVDLAGRVLSSLVVELVLDLASC